MAPSGGKQRVILVTGPSGAGRTTAVRALEDLDFDVIDNLPLSLIDRVLDGQPLDRPLVLGLDVRNREFGIDAAIALIDRLGHDPRIDLQVLYMDCAEDTLVTRYSETRRRHPLAEEPSPLSAIRREREMLLPIRARADFLIDTTTMSVHDARDEIEGLFQPEGERPLSITVQSFSYKRGLPRGVDLVFDCRFLRNPHWDAALRPKTGRDSAVQAYIAEDPRFAPFLQQILTMMELLLPAFREEGKSYLAIAFGCTGGQHRSVALAEMLAKALAENGWPVSIRHRELERREKVGA